MHSYTTRFTNGNIADKGHYIQLPKLLGLAPYAKSREIEGEFLSATIRLDPSGKWFVAAVREVDISTFEVQYIAISQEMSNRDGLSYRYVSY